MATVEEQVRTIVQVWAGMSGLPNSTDALGVLWGNRPVPFPTAAIALAGQLDNQLGAEIQGSDLSVTTTVADIVNLVLS